MTFNDAFHPMLQHRPCLADPLTICTFITLRASTQDESAHRYFLKVLAVTATVNANTVANGKTTKVGCRLNGSAR